MLTASPRIRQREGFTIVELLIVVVVVGILTAITVVAYNGIQQRARDSARQNDAASIIKALELYYTENGAYPVANDPSAAGMNGWSSTADIASWNALSSRLAKYAPGGLPTDPAREAGATTLYSSNYTITTYYCARQTYILVYKAELGNGVIKGTSSCQGIGIPGLGTGYNVIVGSKV